jgi:catechol 2,3-dioxygenase-like lactoylglutathione lyase family enzyme
MANPDIAAIAPFFIVRDVPAALAFYRDLFGFDITFQKPEPFRRPLHDDDEGLRGFEVKDADGYVLFFGRPRA